MCSCAGLTSRHPAIQTREYAQTVRLTLNEPVTRWTEKTCTLVRDAIPIPFEHLGDYVWQSGDERPIERA